MLQTQGATKSLPRYESKGGVLSREHRRYTISRQVDTTGNRMAAPVAEKDMINEIMRGHVQIRDLCNLPCHDGVRY